ncbi:MAG: carbonic anhydrase family protein [Planctomycetia bacterium]|nr:carbonic anhydrase family protein [Planctomycetia bacterium]
MTWRQQSPINLHATIRADAPKDYLRLSWSAAVDGFRRDSDHGVAVNFGVTPDKYLELDEKRYHLHQFHFHHPSEHLLDAKTFDAEVHFVHQHLDDLSLAVVGIFLTVDMSLKETKETTALAESFLLAKDAATPVPLKPAWWLPEKRDRIFRYEGSLTTEPYTESVSWIVLPEPKAISPELFKAIFGSHPHEARAIQPHDRRYILDLAVKMVLVK